jgi:type I restriction enzyme M protein
LSFEAAGSKDPAVFVLERSCDVPMQALLESTGEPKQMFEQTFKNIDDVLWKEAGCATELDYTEQTSWILFLKYLDDLERANEQRAELQGKKYEAIIDAQYRWSVWAAPKKDGSFDHDKALTGDDLIKFVDEKLFRYLKGFKTRAEAANTIEYKIGEIFGEIENKFRSG